MQDLKLTIKDDHDEVKKIVASWYYELYGYSTETGVDGEVYTIAGHEMTFLSSGVIKNSIKYPKMQKSGTYFLRVEAWDKNELPLVRTEKRIEYYADPWIPHFYGSVQNNSIWNISGPRKTVPV